MTVYPFPAPLTTEQAAARLWDVRRLHREGVVDDHAFAEAMTTLQKHPNPKVARAAGAPETVTVSEIAR